MAALRIVATFSGDPVTAFHEGIPARDLTERDWERLTPEQQETVADSKVYDLKPKETKALAEGAEGADQPDADAAPAEVGDVAPVADVDQSGSAPAAADAPAGRMGGKRS